MSEVKGRIEFTQLLHPLGEKAISWVDEMPDDLCEMARGQIITCEIDPQCYQNGSNNKIILYSHPKDGWDEDDGEAIEFADNGPGDNSPKAMLEKLIRRVHAQSMEAPHEPR